MNSIQFFIERNKKEILGFIVLISILFFSIGVFKSVSPVYGRYAIRMMIISVLNVAVFYVVKKTYWINQTISKRILSTLFYFIPEILLIGILIIITTVYPLHEWSSFPFRSIFSGCCIALLYSKIILIIIFSIGFTYMICRGYFAGRRIRRLFLKNFIRTGFIISISFFVMYLISIAFGKSKLIVKEIEIPIKNLPNSFDGYKVVQLSDIHAGSIYSPETIKKIVQQVDQLSPDIILVTGDIVNHTYKELIRFLPELKKMKARDGVYAVLGNHDYNEYSYYKGEKQGDHFLLVNLLSHEVGWTFLNNEKQFMYRDQDSICISGVENISDNKYFESRGDLKLALHGVNQNTPVILLLHDPSIWKDSVVSKYENIALTLSGHTHGMQYSIPSEKIRKWMYPYFHKEMAGLYEQKHQYIYVNGGIGTSMLHGRLGSWMEVTLITLKNEKEGLLEKK